MSNPTKHTPPPCAACAEEQERIERLEQQAARLESRESVEPKRCTCNPYYGCSEYSPTCPVHTWGNS